MSRPVCATSSAAVNLREPCRQPDQLKAEQLAPTRRGGPGRGPGLGPRARGPGLRLPVAPRAGGPGGPFRNFRYFKPNSDMHRFRRVVITCAACTSMHMRIYLRSQNAYAHVHTVRTRDHDPGPGRPSQLLRANLNLLAKLRDAKAIMLSEYLIYLP